MLAADGRVRELNNFASERFTRTSYFTHGIDAYSRWLLDQPLTKSDSP